MVQNLSKDIIYDFKLNRSKISKMGAKYQILFIKCKKLENICIIYIHWHINVQSSTGVVHNLYKDIS